MSHNHIAIRKHQTFKIRKFVSLAASLALLSCTSGGGNTNSGSNTLSSLDSLIITAPKDIKTGVVPNYGYVVITNPTDKAIKNISYQLLDQTNGGQQVTLNSTSASNCSSIPAQHNCIIQLNANNANTSGSFRLVLSDQEKTIAKIKTPTIGVEPAQLNNLSAADGVTLSYYHTVLAGTPYLLVNAIVTANNIGKYNTVILTDGHNNPIPNQQIISANAGAGFSNLFQGSNVSILLPLPTGEISQTIKARVEKVDATGQVSSYSNMGSAGTLVTVKDGGIANMIPSMLYLDQQNPSQTITFTNDGDKEVELKSLLPNNANLAVNFTSTSIKRGEVATATVSLKQPVSNIVSSNINLASSSGDTTSIVYQTPESTLAATSSKMSLMADSESFIAGLTLVFNPDNNFYSTTATGIVTRQLTVTNTGNTVENNIQFSLPANFTLANGTSNSCGVAASNQINNFLNPNESCNLTIIYTNSNVTSLSNANISANYRYNNGISTTPVISTVNYQVSQATANLVATPANYNFGSIYVAGNESSSKIFTVQNIGEATATNIEFGSQAPFKIPSNTCSSLAPGMSCQANVEFSNNGFGGIGNFSSPLEVLYSNTASQNLSTLNGTIYSSVYLVTNQTTGSGFTGGNGSSETPYMAESGSNATLTYYYMSSGQTADLQSFYVDTSELPAGWVRSGGTCSSSAATATTLGRYTYCTITFTFNSTVAGAYNFNQNVMTAHWVDSATNKQLSQTASSDIVYAAISDPSIFIVGTTLPVPSGNINTAWANLALSGVYGDFEVQVALVQPYGVAPYYAISGQEQSFVTLTTENSQAYITIVPTSAATTAACQDGDYWGQIFLDFTPDISINPPNWSGSIYMYVECTNS